MRIMTSNIWGDFFDNPVKLRQDGLYSTYRRYDPDVIGFQEVTAGWYESNLFEKLSHEYRLIGVDRFGSDNYTPMAVKKEYEIIACGRERYVGTPDESKSITWAVIGKTNEKNNEKNNEKIAVCNTHFWWMRGTESEYVKRVKGVADYTFEDHCNLRADNARQLSELMIYLLDKFSVPVFAFGDMNAVVSESVFDVYAEKGIKYLWNTAKKRDMMCSIHGDPVRDGDGNFHGKTADDEYLDRFMKTLCLSSVRAEKGYLASIDHIIGFGDVFGVKQYKIVEDQEVLDSSDHSPVYADIEIYR